MSLSAPASAADLRARPYVKAPPPAPVVAQIYDSKVDAFGLITGQVGYAWNNVLLYVKGGAAVVHDKYDSLEIGTGLPVTHGSETRWGGAVGAGLEFGFAPGWSLGVEYDHLFLGSRDVTLTGQFLDTIRIQQDVDMGLVRLNYRFGGYGAPVAARY